MSIRKGNKIIAGNLGQNVDSALSLTSVNPVQNCVVTRELQNKVSIANTTNALMRIPQDINLEITSDGKLVLKSGSKFYFPNGMNDTEQVFDSYTTNEDIILNIGTESNEYFVVLTNKADSSDAFPAEDVYSGGNAPTEKQHALWYDTGSNLVRITNNNGVTWSATPYSFPLCLIVNVDNKCKSILQVFNGFSYIDSTVVALPGVEGLMPDGRNEDGTLKNVEWETSEVIVQNNYNVSVPSLMAINPEESTIVSIPQEDYFYDSEQNKVYEVNSDGTKTPWEYTVIGYQTQDTIAFNNTFEALDYNNTDHMGHQAMPSQKYMDLTLVVSGATYVAPADGYFTLAKKATADGQYASLVNKDNGIGVNNFGVAGEEPVRVTVPASRGDQITISYTLDGDTELFRFVYSNGAI